MAYYKEPDEANGNNTRGPQLMPADDVEEAVASMLRIWGVYVTAGVLGQYREQLAGLPARAVLEAVKRWLRTPPADRAARPHELRAMAEREGDRRPAPVENVDAFARGRATPEAITEAYAEALRARPDQDFLQWAVGQRARRLAAGASGDGEAEASALLNGLAQAQAMPGAGADIRSLPAPER